MRSPVANGSSVPVWPVLAPVRRRSAATSANDEGPAGLSTSATPTGLSALGGTAAVAHERLPEELDDLLDRRIRGEARRLPMTAAALLARDRRHVDLVVARAQRDPADRALVPRRLANERNHLRALDSAQGVDDPLRERLLRAHVCEVVAQEVRDDQTA